VSEPAPAPDRSSRAARVLWIAVVVTSLVAVVATGWYLLVRGECFDGWVRLIDFGPIVLVLAVLGLAGGVVGLLAASRPGSHRVLAGVGGLALVPLLLLAFVGVSLAVEDVGARQDPACWTF
jgi:hypothetical protein